MLVFRRKHGPREGIQSAFVEMRSGRSSAYKPYVAPALHASVVPIAVVASALVL